MKFDYVQKSSHALSEDTLKLLEEIDAFPYAQIQPRYNTFGDLHDTLTVEVVDTIFERKKRTVQRTIGDIKRRIAELKDELRRLEKRQEQMPRGRKEINRVIKLHTELEILESVLFKNSDKPDDYVVTFDVYTKMTGYYTRSGQDAKVVLEYNENKMEMASTYVHEMMHAYYDSDRVGQSPNVIEYAEEPLAEFGMLCYMQALSCAYPEHVWLSRLAHQSVSKKDRCLGLAHYGFGYYLCLEFEHLDWIEKMYKAKNKVSTADADYQSLQNIFQSDYLKYPSDRFDYFEYSSKQFDTAQLLYDLLTKACGLPQKSIGDPYVSKRMRNDGRSAPLSIPDLYYRCQKVIEPLLAHVRNDVTLVVEHKYRQPLKIGISYPIAVPAGTPVNRAVSNSATQQGGLPAGNGKSFSVEFFDGTFIAESTAVATYIEALKHFGLSTVQDLGLEDGGYNIVSDTERLDNGRKWQTFANGKYIYTAIAKKSMIANLALVAGELGMQITIKKC